MRVHVLQITTGATRGRSWLPANQSKTFLPATVSYSLNEVHGTRQLLRPELEPPVRRLHVADLRHAGIHLAAIEHELRRGYFRTRHGKYARALFERTVGACAIGKTPGRSGRFPVRSRSKRKMRRIASWFVVTL
jgi:hypothetical protein